MAERKKTYRSQGTGLVLLVILGLALGGVTCKKFEPERRLLVQTDTILSVLSTSFTVEGSVIFLGEGSIEQYGFCYSESADPGIESSAKNELGTKNATGSFQSTFTGLTGNTSYFVRAYATDAYETAYGEVFEVNTVVKIPTVRTTAVSGITSGSASTGGIIDDNGGAEILARGVCWGTGPELTIAGDTTRDGTGTGSFTSSLKGLSCETRYYVRAYATNSHGTGYGDTISFTTGTCSLDLPVVSTTTATSITETSAMGGGNVTNAGGSAVTERGVCWSTSQTPTIADEKKQSGSGTGSFTVAISGLSCNTTYYVRAYATNSSGTSYGEQVTFTSKECSAGLPVVATAAVTNITVTSALSGGEITNDGGSAVTARGVCWSMSQDPSLSDSFTEDGTGTGTFTSTIAGLTGGTTYYVRAYASNSSGTTYGGQRMFITVSPMSPSVFTLSISGITESSAQSGGNVTDEGTYPVTSKGVCWNTSGTPTILDQMTSDGAGAGSYSSVLTGLSCATTYYVRAFAISSAGVGYGSQEVFTTSDCPAGLPEVTTAPVINITPRGAFSGGEVISDGGSEVTARGICWSKAPGPDISDDTTLNGSGIGTFGSLLDNLESNTQYYVRAYATNSIGTAYGEERSFNTNPDALTDYDGNSYQTVLIGEQTWMAENLKVKHYSDGTAIPLVENNAIWDALTTSDKAYCWNDNNATTGDVYGALYTWAAAMNGVGSSDAQPSGVQGVCPTGWHLPGDSEWKQLEMHLGMSQAAADNTGWRGDTEGGKLKEAGTIHWNSPNTSANNESGFTALPGGNRYDYGTFFNVGSSAFFWTTTEGNTSQARARNLSYNIGKIYRSDYHKANGFSVRCIKN